MKDGESFHRNFNRNNFKKSSYDTSKLQCYQCKKIWHIAPNCPQRTKANEQSNLIKEDLEPTFLMAILEDSDEKNQVKEVEEQKVSLHEEDVGYKETNMDSLWYLDNGANNHMTGVREHFKELDKKVSGKVRFRDGSYIEIKGKGLIQIERDDEKQIIISHEDETIDTFIGKLTTLVNKAASIVHTIKDQTLVRKLLNAVPDRYLQIVASIEQYSDLSEMTMEEAIGRLKTYKERIKYKKGKQVKNQEKLMFTRYKSKGKHFRGRGRGKHRFSQGKSHKKFKEGMKDRESSHKNFNRNNFKKSSYNTSKLQCYQCKKIWHIAPNCPQRTKANEQSNLVEEDLEPTLLMAILEDSDEKDQVKELKEQKVSLHEEDVGYKETNMDSLWYLDNGASNHMTGVREDFKELDKKKEDNGKVYRLIKALYRLRQAPRAWNIKLDNTLKSLDFNKYALEQAIYTKISRDSTIIVGVYVDDLIIIDTPKKEIDKFKDQMEEKFKMSDLGFYYLGIKVMQTSGDISIKQTAYENKILKEAGIIDCNETLIPMNVGTRLTKITEGTLVNSIEY
nr:ribonuclease H-like domain, reverse transcriptase, RNA-dependent DNA polymerase [Tanacetum cinerariifolium]